MAATRVWSSPYPFHCPSWTRSLRVTHELRGRQPQWLCSEFVPFLLLFDCQEAFHCCLVVTCINRINMISIQCHRVGEWWSGKPEFENVSDPAGVYIPFKGIRPAWTEQVAHTFYRWSVTVNVERYRLCENKLVLREKKVSFSCA